MSIKNDYIAGEVRTAAQVNEENTQILANIADDTAFADSWNGDTDTSPSKNTVYDILTSPYISSGSASVGGSVAVPSGAFRAVCHLLCDDQLTSGRNAEGQVTIFKTGLTTANFDSIGNGTLKSTVVTWSGSNINVTGDSGGHAYIYFFKY